MCLKVLFFARGPNFSSPGSVKIKGNGFGRVRCRAHLLCAAPLTAATTPRYFCFTFIRSVYEKVLGATDARKGFGKFAGLAIGLALGLVNIVGITVDNCSVNPARSFGPALWCPEAWPDFWIMVVGPLVGAAIAALCWIVLTGNRNRHAIED